MALSKLNERPKTIQYGGTINATAGQTVKLETTPNGEEALAIVVPAGKAWEVKSNITILETDA